MLRTAITIVLSVLIVVQMGCAPKANSPYVTPSNGMRDPQRAQQLTRQAGELIDVNPEKAEGMLKEALAADIYHGPAHNNLGVLYLNRGQLYEAANEFEWAKKLMPSHPDPRMNLALTLERAGRIDEALATYDSALEVYPNHMPTMQALVRLQVRRNRTDDCTVDMLKEIALAGESDQWRGWAKQILVAQ